MNLQSHTHQTNTTIPPKSLVIIGAGVASIKLAHTILQHSPTTSLTILEANDYIGGRVRSIPFAGHTVEKGANWIPGREDAYDNPVWRLAKQVGLRGHVSDRDDAKNIHVVKDGTDVTAEYLDASKRFHAVYEKAVQKAMNLGFTPQNDTSVRSLLEQCGWPSHLTPMERAVEHNILEIWVSDGLERLSSCYDMNEGANDVDLGQDEFFVEDERGFGCILDGMVRDIENWGGAILLGKEVIQVQYLPDDVKVVARDVASGKTTEYAADAVVSTVSLGVLQSECIEFVPPLPEWKIAALNEIGMFHFGKCYVRFKTKFWPDKDQLLFVNGKKKGHYPLWMRYRNADPDQHLYMCYLGGAEARRVESLTEDEIKNEVEALFRGAFHNEGQDANIFRPLSVAVTDWSRNPRFCGSYSYFPVRAFADLPYSDLTRGLTGGEGVAPITLHFAGECFDDKFNGWVQGAYRSGERVANAILGIKKP